LAECRYSKCRYAECRAALLSILLPFQSTQITAEEIGLSGQSASADVTVNIVDENDNVPKFSDVSYDVTIPENVRPGTVILRV
jgi:hypothetical protein